METGWREVAAVYAWAWISLDQPLLLRANDKERSDLKAETGRQRPRSRGILLYIMEIYVKFQ